MASYPAHRRPARASGFTLIELVIVVAIIAILASVAYPSYVDHVRRGRIAEVFGTLGDGRTRFEQYFQDLGRYTETAGTTTCPTSRAVCPANLAQFTITCTCADTTYTITATGNAGSSVAGVTYTINERNQRRTTAFPGASGLPLACWIDKKVSAC